ncbi:MAG: DUF4407 domain-containing protein [Flavobacteriaceae bacterium]|nr:DUF4407 domain-containing protein [Flavobacteriaceae bacterium]
MRQENNKLNGYLWNLSGFKKEIIRESKVDGYHATVIGVLLLVVGVYAMFAWTFFFQTVSDNAFVPIVAGIFMGFYIISFDRALIASMSSGKINIFSVIFRLVLATLLGVFLAQPMILKFYENDVKRESQIIVDIKNQDRKKELEAIYATDLSSLNSRKTDLKNQLNDKTKELIQAETDFKSEMDGSGGTKKQGYSTISKKKEGILDHHRTESLALNNNLKPEIAQIQTEINDINNKINSDFESFRGSNTSFGTLVQAEALESLLNKDKTGKLRIRYYLLAFILTLIELSALIAKMLFGMKSYKKNIADIEEEELMQGNKIEISKKYKELALVNELELMQSFFDKSKRANEEKLNDLIKGWRAEPDATYKELCESFDEKFKVEV